MSSEVDPGRPRPGDWSRGEGESGPHGREDGEGLCGNDGPVSPETAGTV